MSKPAATLLAEIKPVPSIPHAIGEWSVTVLLLSSVVLFVPLIVPLADSDHLDLPASFGKGELLGFAFGLLAAAISRWIVHQRTTTLGLRGVTLFCFAVTGIMIGVLWFDTYNAEKNANKVAIGVNVVASPDLYFRPSFVLVMSWFFVGISLVLGLVTEVLYAWGQNTKVRVNS